MSVTQSVSWGAVPIRAIDLRSLPHCAISLQVCCWLFGQLDCWRACLQRNEQSRAAGDCNQGLNVQLAENPYWCRPVQAHHILGATVPRQLEL